MALINEREFNRQKKKNSDKIGILNEKNIVDSPLVQEKAKKVIASFADIFPIRDFAEHDFFEMRNGEFMEIVQVTSKDIYSLNEGDKDSDIFSVTYMYQAYISDMKIVPLHTPVNLEIQKNKVLKDIRNCKRKQYLPFLEKKLLELEFIEEHRTNKEYFLFLYANTVKSLQEKKILLRRLLAQSNPVIELELSKKINVLFQMTNLNTKPKVD